MDVDKMSCGQEVGMSRGEASTPSIFKAQITPGNFTKQTSDYNLKRRTVSTSVSLPVSWPVSLPVSWPTIYKVPQRFRQANKDAFDPYKPQIVSIGPYHKEKEFEKHKQKEFEKRKQLYRDSIVSRNPNHTLEDYRMAIMTLEAKARSCYSEDVDLNPDEFVEMMLFDGCFIVELFLMIKENKFEDPIFHTIWMLPLIRYDMLLLENQIPFFVLEIIYEMACPGNSSLVKLALDFFKPIIPKNKENKNGSLVEFALDFFKPIIPKKNKENKIEVSEDLIKDEHFHLLHLLHSYLKPTPRAKSKKCKILMFLCSKGSNKPELPIRSPPIKNGAELSNSNNLSEAIMMIPCAAELQLAGVKFKKKKDYRSFLDVEFSSCGVLEIPHLCIDDYTDTLLRNLVALEQMCYPGVKTIHFTNYIGFMDCLVNTSNDVALLHRNRIIDHLLGSDEHVAGLFNQLGNGIVNDFEDHNYLSGIYKDVDKYYNTTWNRCWASLRSDYFTNPWAGLSSAAAVILILLTMAQTFYTIFPYYRPGS